MKLTSRISLLTGAVALLLAAVAGGVALTANTNNQQLNHVFNDVGPLRTDTEQLTVALLDQETGIRGYALAGSEADLEPYTDGLASQQTLIADLRSRSHGYPKVMADLNNVQDQIDQWRSAVAQPTIDQVRAGNEVGARALLNESAKNQFDAVRAAMAQLQTDVLAIRNSAVEQVQGTSRDIVWEVVAAAIVVIIGGILLVFLLRRFVLRPIDRLAGSVRTVAGGDFNHAIDTSGPPELARLGQDVDNMRQRIVDDLRVVQHARDDAAAANAALEQHAADLIRSNEDLEQFAYVASHDLQEPLRKVASFCQLLQRRYANQLDERADQYIAFAVDGAHRMQRLINDLLKFSRIGRVTADFRDVDLGEVAASVAAANRSAIEATGGSVTWHDLPTIAGEEPLLVALFANLVSNAIKFRRPNQPVRVEISAGRSGEDWQISCVDNGIGIEAAYVDKIFVIFQRLHPRETYPGTGIGLAIAKRIVEYHGGRIWADTAVEQGATIRFTLPVRPRPQALDGADPVAVTSAIG